MFTSNRRGFTLVELLVVIAIIGVLISLLLPAVQASREAVRRTQCLNNLSQLSIGIQNYFTAHEAYPAGTLDKQGPIHSLAAGDHRNWIIQILPYIDEANVYRHVDQTAGVYDAKNAPVRALALAILTCPSDYAERGEHPASHYAAVHHDFEAPIDADNHGAFFLNSRLLRDDISDGLSHTLFIGEKLIEEDDFGWMSGTRATLRNAGSPLNSALPPLPGLYLPRSESDDVDRNAIDQQSAVANETAPRSGKDNPPSDPTRFVGGFNSRHAAGVNFAFGDGSTRFLSEAMSLDLLQQLANRSDGKLTPSPY